MRKIAIRLAMNTFTSIEFFMNLSIDEFFSITQEVQEVSKENGK